MQGRRECGRCGTWITKGNYARHVRRCARREGERNDRGAKGRVKGCDRCGSVLTVDNMARHQRGASLRRRGGNQVLDGGRWAERGEEEII